jgi:hypothetical protein
MEENKKERHILINSAVKEDKYFDLKTLMEAYTYPEENIQIFYAQSLSVVEFLLDKYPGDKLWSLARRLVQERAPIEKALQGAYWPDIENLKDLEKQWLGWIKDEK